MNKIYYYLVFGIFFWSLSSSMKERELRNNQGNVIVKPSYTSHHNLVMAGYQGWFAANGDESNRGWYHYQNGSCGGFFPGCSSIDFWPDITDEYTKIYPSPFKFADGTTAPLFSSFDEETVDLHFKWMKEYGIDGVHMQRFVAEVKPSNPSGKRHFNKVLSNALKAAKKYNRAISIMYDLSGCSSNDIALVEADWQELVQEFDLYNLDVHPTFLHHNGRPLMSIWGVGFNDNRRYTTADVNKLVDRLQAKNEVSILLGVPYFWRTLDRDTESSPALHDLIKKADIILPWAVGRYNSQSYSTISSVLKGDIEWSAANNVDYIPLAFPGFTWGNLRKDPSLYNAIPRDQGAFFWKQVAGAKQAGAKTLYIAMFDEIDEGTAIFKSARQSKVPTNGNVGLKFIGIEDELPSDYYLWLSGQAAKWFHGDDSFGVTKPIRNN